MLSYNGTDGHSYIKVRWIFMSNNDMMRMITEALSNNGKQDNTAQANLKNKLQGYVSSMSDEQKAQLQSVLSDENKLKSLLSSQKAQQLLKQLQK